MEIERVKNEIIEIKESQTLTEEQKTIRIKMVQAYLESLIQEQSYHEKMSRFIEHATELENMTNGSYQLQDTLEYNKISLKGILLESDLVKELNEKGIENFTIADLRAHSYHYDQEHQVDMTTIDTTIFLYTQIEELEKIEEKKMEMISRTLGSILGENVVSKYIEKSYTNQEGQLVIEQIEKTEEELQKDYQSAYRTTDELYVNEGTLDIKTKNITINMLNQLFDYYKNGHKKLPLAEIKMENTEIFGEQEKMR